MIIVGLELAAPSNLSDHAADPSASASPFSLRKPRAEGGFKYSFIIDDNRVQSPPASKPESSVRKLETNINLSIILIDNL